MEALLASMPSSPGDRLLAHPGAVLEGPENLSVFLIRMDETSAYRIAVPSNSSLHNVPEPTFLTSELPWLSASTSGPMR